VVSAVTVAPAATEAYSRPAPSAPAPYTLTFSKPGTYTLRAFGHDGILRAPADVTVTVDGPGPSQ